MHLFKNFENVGQKGNIYWVLFPVRLLAMLPFTLCRIGLYLIDIMPSALGHMDYDKPILPSAETSLVIINSPLPLIIMMRLIYIRENICLLLTAIKPPKAKAIVQQYNNRLIESRVTVN